MRTHSRVSDLTHSGDPKLSSIRSPSHTTRGRGIECQTHSSYIRGFPSRIFPDDSYSTSPTQINTTLRFTSRRSAKRVYSTCSGLCTSRLLGWCDAKLDEIIAPFLPQVGGNLEGT